MLHVIPFHCGIPPFASPSRQKRFIATTHSATDETWMTQVGSERALAGSGCGGSKIEAGREARRSRGGVPEVEEQVEEEEFTTSAKELTTRVSSAATAVVASLVSSASVSMAAEA